MIVFVVGFVFPFVFILAQGLLAVIAAVLVLEIFVLFIIKSPLKGEREVANQISMGDENKVVLRIHNGFKFPVTIKTYDNLPVQFQVRNRYYKSLFMPSGARSYTYFVRPEDRGEYFFDDIYSFVSILVGFAQRKVVIPAKQKVVSYPSIIQMKKYELKVFSKTAQQGIKKIRRLGHNNEFEQIKYYVQGDDIRTINWKATSRMNELMVNQYQDERAQNVYSIIDKSRAMRMPFDDLTLLDHSINSTLAFSNICLRKGDKVGLMTFSDKLGSKIAAERSSNQLQRIIEILYKQKTRFLESNYELLYQAVRTHIKGRSLIMLYSNIESEYALKRVLPLLKKINQQHVLCVIFFQNTEIAKVSEMEPKHVRDIYTKTFAEKYAMDKKKIAMELRKHNIQAVLTTPQNLTIDTINKYLELKAKGAI